MLYEFQRPQITWQTGAHLAARLFCRATAAPEDLAGDAARVEIDEFLQLVGAAVPDDLEPLLDGFAQALGVQIHLALSEIEDDDLLSSSA